MRKLILIVPALLILTACAIRQDISPVTLDGDLTVHIIENPRVREAVLSALKSEIEKHNYNVAVVDASSTVTDYPIAVTYTANWNWDLAMYMSYAEIKVYLNGSSIGEAVYNSRRGGARMDKFISADKKIRELVNELLQ